MNSSRLAELQARIQRLERSPAQDGVSVVALGYPSLDDHLGGGLPRAAFHEIMGPSQDGAVTGFALRILGKCMQGAATRRRLLWCCQRRAQSDRGRLYGPALAQLGLDPSHILFVTTDRPADLFWAMEEGLRSACFDAVVGEGAVPDLTASRRLQLAAAASGTLALSLPSPAHPSAISAAVSRWCITSLPATGRTANDGPVWHVELRRCRSAHPRSWLLHLGQEHAAHHIPVVADLANRSLAAAS